MTEIREQGFAIDLPGEWDEVESDEDGTRRYRQRDGEGRVSVTLLSVNPSHAAAGAHVLLGQYLEHRMRFEKGQRAWMTQSQPLVEDTGDGAEGSWSGEDPGVLRRLRHRVLLRDGVLADALFEAPDDEFEERSSAVLGTLRIETP